MYIRLLKMGDVKSVAAGKNTLVKPNTHNIITMKGHNTRIETKYTTNFKPNPRKLC